MMSFIMEIRRESLCSVMHISKKIYMIFVFWSFTGDTLN